MKIIILILTICSFFSSLLFGMEKEQQPFKIWNSNEVRIFFPDIGYKKNQDKKYYAWKGCLFKENDYYTLETCINDQKFKACLQLNNYQKECIEKNENTMTILLKDKKGNIQIDIEKINDKECKKPDVTNLFDDHIFSEDKKLAVGDEGYIPKYLNVLTFYSNKIYSQEDKSFISIYKQNYQNVIKTFGEGNQVPLPFFLEEIKQLETKNKPFYLYVNNKTDNTVKALIRVAQINDKILHIGQKRQDEEYINDYDYNLFHDEVLSDRTDSEKIHYIESLVYDIYLFLQKENIQRVERGDYPSDSISDPDTINQFEKIFQENQQLKTQLDEIKQELLNTKSITEDLKTCIEKTMQENRQSTTQLADMKSNFATFITNQNKKIVEKIHSVMYCVSFWAIVFLMYCTYKNNKILIFN